MGKVSVGRILIAAFGCIALASIIGGIAVIGTPAERRLIELDKKRVHDLNRLANEVRSYHTRNGDLPERLAGISYEWVAHVRDPVTGDPYTYRVTGERSFQLCGVFARKFDKPVRRNSYLKFQVHEQGFHCFDQIIEHKKR
jgi:hypothetical protein